MTMARRVALLMLLVLVLALPGSWFVHTLAARDALRAELHRRNADTAAALAVALAPILGDTMAVRQAAGVHVASAALRELVVLGPEGQEWFRGSHDASLDHVPGWFSRLFSVDAAAGRAPTAAGGSSMVVAAVHAEGAERALWAASAGAAFWLGWVVVLAATLLAVLLRAWRRPLQAALEQGRALAQGRFVEAPEEPAWPELHELTAAMNSTVRRLHGLFDTQAEQVARLQRQAQTDAVTRLPVRSQFIGRIGDMLGDAHAPGSALLLVRVPELERLNEGHGREATDHLLVALADVLLTYVERVAGAAAGRLNGTDFGLCLPAAGIARETAESVAAALAAAPAARLSGALFLIGACDGLRGLTAQAALAAADAALAQAEAGDGLHVEESPEVIAGGARQWRELIASALDQSRVRLAAFPVVDAGGALIHLECPLRVQMQPGGEYLVAQRWLALATRSRLTHQVDLSAVDLALKAIASDGRPRCVHVCPQSFGTPDFAPALRARIQGAAAAARQLSIEWTEASLAREGMPALRQALADWRRLGVTVGVEHAGASPRELPHVKDLGVDYVKVDARHVRGIADDNATRSYAESLVALIHGLGMRVFAEGIDDTRDLAALWTLGFDGATGRAVPPLHD